jgi:uncharacterized protein YaeQ
MALTATVYQFDIDFADHDRHVFETLSLRVARHPSESDDYLWARVLAYALEFEEGIQFSPGGLSDPDAPAIVVRDLTGALRAWIEIGTPDAARLHRAAKAAPRVAVYVHRDPAQFLARLSGERIHQAGAMRIVSIDRGLLSALAAALDRRMSFSLSVSDDELFVSFGSQTLTGRLKRHTIGA